MKRLLFIIFLLCSFVPNKSMAQSTKTVTLTFSEDDFHLSERNDGSLNISSLKYFINFKPDSLQPSLPFILKDILLDLDKEYNDCVISLKDTLLKTDVFLYTNPVPRLASAKCIPSKLFFTNSNQLFPSNIACYTGTHQIENKEYASFLISPFSYDALNHKLYLNKSITLNIRQKEKKEDVIKNGPANSRNNFLQESERFEYLIITNDSLKPYFQKLANWKTTKGIPTMIVTTKEINDNYKGNASPQLKIKQAIKDYWWSNMINPSIGTSNLHYVLLGGDTNIIPSQMCMIKCDLDSLNIQHTPSDWFYSCLNDNVLDWDNDGNGDAGEISDNIDMGAELVVSRLSVSSIQECDNVVERIINYERNPSVDDWEDNILMCGAMLDTIANSGLSDAQIEGNITYWNYIHPYWNGEQFRLYDTGSDLEGGVPYHFIIEDFQQQLSKGYSFVNVDTHGNENSFKMGWESNVPSPSMHYSYYTSAHADSLINKGNSVIVTCACFTNAFDYDKCLSEAFIRNRNGGILAFVGPSREGWLVEDSMYSHQFNRKLYQTFFTRNDRRLSQAFVDAKNQIIGLCHSYAYPWRWIFFSENLLGDPEMPIYTSLPIENDSLEISYYDNEFTINTGRSIICVMSRDDMGASFYEIASGNLGYTDFDDERTFCVRKNGYIPYIGVFAPTVHLQNEYIKWNYHVFGNTTFIGHNVTNNREEGAFVIGKGKTTINSPQGVTINDSFEVKLGAELEININN